MRRTASLLFGQSLRFCAAPRLWTHSHRDCVARLLHLSAPACSASLGSGVASLASWIEQHGGWCSKLYVKHSESAGRSVHCRTAISADERIVRVPRRLLLSTADCRQSDVGRLVDRAGKPFTNPQSYIAAFVLQERTKGEASFFHPFLASLPASFSSFPLLYSDGQLSLLRGSQVLYMVAAQRADVHSDYLTLMSASPPFSFSLEQFYAARLAVGSRVFGAALSDDPKAESEAVLVPYVDLLNHGEQHHIHWTYEPSLQQFTCRSLLPIEPAAEVLTTYGSRCNCQLLAHYGFALEENDSNEAQLQVGLRPHGAESEAMRMRKVRVLDGLDGELAEQVQWRLGKGHRAELDRLISYLRLCEADDADMWGVGDGSSTERVKAIPVLGPDNERRVWLRVSQEAQRRIAAFPASLSDFESLSCERPGSVERLCALVCASELRVLHWLVRLSDVCVEALGGRVVASDVETALRQLDMSPYWSTLQPLLAQTSKRKQATHKPVYSYN